MSKTCKALLCAAFLSVCTIAASAQTASTDRGRISVAQVFDLAGRADAEHGARMALIAYLAAVGETTGVLLQLAEARDITPFDCTNPFSLDQEVALDALHAAAPQPANWSNTEATPIILADMIERAGCR